MYFNNSNTRRYNTKNKSTFVEHPLPEPDLYMSDFSVRMDSDPSVSPSVRNCSVDWEKKIDKL